MHGQLAWPSTAPPRARRVAAERAATRARRAGVARAYAGASLQPASVPSERAVEGGDGVGAGAWRSANGAELKDLPPPPRGVADDPQLHNPLVRGAHARRRGWRSAASVHQTLLHSRIRADRLRQERLERLGCGWMGAIFEMEGVLVEDRSAEHRQARPPPLFLGTPGSPPADRPRRPGSRSPPSWASRPLQPSS